MDPVTPAAVAQKGGAVAPIPLFDPEHTGLGGSPPIEDRYENGIHGRPNPASGSDGPSNGRNARTAGRISTSLEAESSAPRPDRDRTHGAPEREASTNEPSPQDQAPGRITVVSSVLGALAGAGLLFSVAESLPIVGTLQATVADRWIVRQLKSLPLLLVCMGGASLGGRLGAWAGMGIERWRSKSASKSASTSTPMGSQPVSDRTLEGKSRSHTRSRLEQSQSRSTDRT